MEPRTVSNCALKLVGSVYRNCRLLLNRQGDRSFATEVL